jgi:hypothetical protein
MSDMKAASRLIVAAMVLLAVVSPALADDDAHFRIAPYLWVPGFDAEVGVRDISGGGGGGGGDISSNVPPYDVLGNLDYAVMLAGEARGGKLGLVFDGQAVKLSDEGTQTTPVARGFEYEVTVADATLALEYRVVDGSNFTLDALAGARVMHGKIAVDLDATITDASLDADQDKTWVDPIVGAKCSYRIGEKWSLNGYGDIGGFDVASKLTYQAMGTVSYSFNDNIALHAGYRVFGVDYDRDDFKLDLTLHGPLIGLAFTF